jgi:hypothetical protein
MSAADFKKSVMLLNAQFWLLMGSVEHLQSVAQTLAPLQRSRIGPKSHQQPHNYETVMGTLLFGASKSRSRIRLRNHAFADDLRVLASGCETWLPGYFLVLAKSLAEGNLIEALTARVASDKAVEGRLDTFRKKFKKPPTRKKAIESCVQGSVRGSYDDLDQVVALSTVRAKLDTLTATLDSYAKVRNQLAHRLALHTKPTVTSGELERFISSLTTTVELLSSVI